MGTETFAEGLSLHAGGGAFITSAAFSALGWKVALLTTLPAAPFTEIVANDIAKFGIDTQLCAKADPGASPQITVAVADQHDRAFLTHKSGKSLPDRAVFGDAFVHLHIGELRSLVEHPSLIEKARNAGMTISVDCGWDEDILSQGAEMSKILAQVDVFLPNETEFERLIASGFSQESCPLIVVKCGANGARALNAGEWVSQPTQATTVVDATGAGDAFNGGFLSSWLRGDGISESLITGNRCGRSSVTHAGGTDGIMAMQTERLLAI
jgi:sugar/nucleoside kinase (ribokinase family)